MTEYFLLGFDYVFTVESLFYLFLGTLIGLLFGMIPGLSGVTAVALLVPFSFGLSPIAAMLLMIGVYCSATYSGSVSGVIFNMPGDVMGAATAIEGYQMTKKGQTLLALSTDVFSSFCGGIIGTIMLIFIAPQLVKIALTFGSPEFFALAILGLSVVSGMGTKSPMKALVGVFFGLWLATIGLDPVSGITRFTWGNVMLGGGIDFIPAIIGFFALSEIFYRMYERVVLFEATEEVQEEIRTTKIALPSLKHIKQIWQTILRSSVIGNIVGMLPGAGATVAAFLGYGIELRVSRNPKIGTGEIEGVAAPEAANNSATAGAMVPLLCLGIPGSATAAVMLGVLILHGLRPGPLLFVRMPELTYSVFVGYFVANIFFLILAAVGLRYLVRILMVRFDYLSVYLIIFCVVGTFAIYNRMIDVWIMFICGIVGFFFKKYDYSIAAVVLGLVLGRIAENGLVNGIAVTRGDFVAFFSRPMTYSLLIVSLIFLLLPAVVGYIRSRHENKQKTA